MGNWVKEEYSDIFVNYLDDILDLISEYDALVTPYGEGNVKIDVLTNTKYRIQIEVLSNFEINCYLYGNNGIEDEFKSVFISDIAYIVHLWVNRQ